MNVVIVGGGFGGLQAARAFEGAPVRVTLLDRHNYHLFQPLLYQVATAALSPGDVASPIRWILRKQKNVQVLLADVRGIDAANRRVIVSGADAGDNAFAYDYLILATGAAHAYFGHAEWAARAPGLKTLDDALEMRRRVLLTFEAAERESDPVKRQRLLTFVIVVGGPTGVELAGALAEIARCSLPQDFRSIHPESARIVLVEGGPDLLGYRKYGSMATIGRGSAVADIGPVKASGFLAWVFWLCLHIFWLIGFRNRFAVMTEWAWAYLTFQRRVRLITGEKLWPQ